jgi:hypothetical protein
MFDLSLTIKGDTEDDLELAMLEILRLIREGFTSGFDSNESGSYSFTVASNFCAVPPAPATAGNDE